MTQNVVNLAQNVHGQHYIPFSYLIHQRDSNVLLLYCKPFKRFPILLILIMHLCNKSYVALVG